MATNTGSLTIDNLLAVEHQSAADFGLDTIEQVLQADVAAHNNLVEEMLDEMADVTTDRQRIYGASQQGEMVEVDSFGRSATQQPTPGSEGAYPLRKFQFAIGWHDDWFKVHTPADMARAVQGGQKAHWQRIQTEVKHAIFRASNYTFNDFLIDKINLNVKRFVNADSAPIPDGPNGESFVAATHTHYDANASLTNAVLLALVDDVVEHGHGSMVKLCINRANEAAVKALADFEPYVDPRMSLGTHANQPDERLDITRVDNRAIGIFGAAEVWVKPWVPANYAWCYDAGDEGKPLAFREREQAALRGLRIKATLDSHPLHAQYMEAEFGVGVWTRTNGAVLQFNNATYQDPF